MFKIAKGDTINRGAVSNMGFRDEVFCLCKKIQKNDEIKNVVKLITDLKNTNDETESDRAGFSYVARNDNNQFYGYLYTNDHTEEYLSLFPKIEPLEKNEIQLIARAHATIMRLVHGCLDEFESQYPKLAYVMNPYWRYFTFDSKYEDAESFLEDVDYQKAIDAFKSSALYRKLFTSEVTKLVETISEGQIQEIFGKLENEMQTCPTDQVPEAIDNLTKALYAEYMQPVDVLMAETVLGTALQFSLQNACSLLFTALVGEDLIVLNDDNLISIDDMTSNIWREYTTLCCDESYLFRNTGIVGDIVLMDCHSQFGNDIHKFGQVRSYTANYDHAMGISSKFTLVIVDEDLNPLSQVTKLIISREFPIITVRKKDDR